MDPHSADQSRRDGALRTYSLLVGAMTLAKAQNNPEIFERCVTLFSMERWRQRRAQSLSNPTSSPTLPT